MIRTTREAPYFGLWRDLATLDALTYPKFLTTARYDPICRSSLGTGHVDLLFEKDQQTCVLGALRLSPYSLVSRERSLFVWPIHLAKLIETKQLLDIERFLTPWLRSLARARPMAREAIRRFSPSERFERARAAGLCGAVPLDQIIPRMAPFIYARRYAAGSRVLIDCADDTLAHAVLADLAASISYTGRAAIDNPTGDRAFAQAWYGVRSRGAPQVDGCDVVLTDGESPTDASVVIETTRWPHSRAQAIQVPSPAPWDLLFSFDAADAPVVSQFSVHAVEPPLRACQTLAQREVCGNSGGNIVFAFSSEALAMRGADVHEAETLQGFLEQEGFTVSILADVGDARIGSAQLVHIFGAATDAHMAIFGEAARARGVDFIFDVGPRPRSPSAFIENMLVLAFRAAPDEAEIAHYLKAYEDGRLTGTPAPEPTAEEYAFNEGRFAELAIDAVAILAAPEDIDGLREWLPRTVADRVLARYVFAAPEPAPARIGHLVPNKPFAFVHGTMCARSNALFATFAADRHNIPLVIAGSFYDVEYLQTLRTVAPQAVVLVDPEPGVLSAIYRRAAIWIDCAPRPPSAAPLVRAAACGALPILATESPLARTAGPRAPTFRLTSFEECGATLVEAMTMLDRDQRIATLQARLGPRRDPTRAFGALIEAYARTATTV